MAAMATFCKCGTLSLQSLGGGSPIAAPPLPHSLAISRNSANSLASRVFSNHWECVLATKRLLLGSTLAIGPSGLLSFVSTHAIGPSGLGPISDSGYDPSDQPIAAVKDDSTSLEDLKQLLVDMLYGTDRGLGASSETRGEIVEIITQLEAKNPTPAPTEALSLLNGKWILGYTSSSELYPLLAAGNLPLVKVGEISQTFDSAAFTVQNTVSFTGPLSTTSFSNSGVFEVRSPKRVQVKFEEGIISTPQLTDSIEIPPSVKVLGQDIDLTPFEGILRPLQNAATSVARTISGHQPFKFPIQAYQPQSWLLNTYLDQDLRISRGDGGSLFVLIKAGSPLLSYL